MHIECEALDGNEGLTYCIKDPEFKYQCPWCRIHGRPTHKPKEKRERK